MESSSPMCFVALEIPLTVTFTVESGSDEPYNWTCKDFGRESNDNEYCVASILTNYPSILRSMPKSLSFSDILANIPNNTCDTSTESLQPEDGVDLAVNQIACKSSGFRNGIDEKHSFIRFYNSLDQLQDCDEDFVPFDFSSSDEYLDDHCHGNIHDDVYSFNDDFFVENLNSRTSCSQFLEMAYDNSQEVKNEAYQSDNNGNIDSCFSYNTEEVMLFGEKSYCDFSEEASAAVIGNGKELNLTGDFSEVIDSLSGDVFGNDNSSQYEFSCCKNGTILPFTEHSDESSTENDDLKLKNEEILMDLEYFAEVNSEEGKDEEDCSISPTGTSVSDVHSAASSSLNGNDCCDEIQRQRATKPLYCRSKSGILKHSRTSASFNFSSSSTSPKDNNNWTDHYRVLPDSVSIKGVAHFDYPNPVYKRTVEPDGSEAMEILRGITDHLCLPVNNVSRREEFFENHSQPVTKQWRKVNVRSETENSLINSGIAYGNVNEFISVIKHELFQMRKADEKIAARLLVLYGEIKQYKYIHNCHLYREMMEDAIDNEDKKDELSRHHVDTIPDRLCSPFKQWGLTRINLQRRRFSIF